MTTATLTGPLVSPSGQTLTRRRLTAELVSAPGSAGHHSMGEIIERHSVLTDNAGAFSLALPLNSEVVPAGTFWRITCGRYTWLVALDTAGTYAIGDPAIQVISPEPPGWVPLAGPVGPAGPAGATGAAGAPGGIDPSTVALRPAATSVPDGTMHYATDLSGGQLAVSDGVSWQNAAPPLATAFGGRHLGGAQLATNLTNAGVSAAADIPGMSVTFTPSGGPVLLVVSALFTQLRRTTWTPVSGTLKAPSLSIQVDGATVVGLAGPDVDISIVGTTGTGRSVAASIAWPVTGLSVTSHTAKLVLPGQATEHTWGVSQGFPTFGTPGTRLDVVQLS